MAASFYGQFSGVIFTPFFSVSSIDYADIFMDVNLADVGASHFRLDAVQVQGAVLTSTHCYRVDGHLLVRIRSQCSPSFTLVVAVISLLLFGVNMHFLFTVDLFVVVPEGGNITDAYVTCWFHDQFVPFFVEVVRWPNYITMLLTWSCLAGYCSDQLFPFTSLFVSS